MSTASTTRHSQRIPELDGVRGLAILMVLVWHYVSCEPGALTANSPLALFVRATSLTWTGVDLFFVLSGFLIGGILLDHSASKGFYKTFYVRRAARILPVYVLTLCCFFACRAFLTGGRFDWLFSNEIPDHAYLLFVQNVYMGYADTFGSKFLAVTWSLAVEEQFYLAVPVLLLLCGISRFKRVVIVLPLCAPFCRLVMPGLSHFVNMPCRMDALLAGVILAAVFRNENAVRLLKDNTATLWCVFLVLLAGMGVMTFQFPGNQFMAPTAIAAFYTTFIALVLIHQGGKVTFILRSGWLMRLGLYSYGIYMYHMIVAGLVHGALRGCGPDVASKDALFAAGLSLVLTIVAAILSHHCFEAWFLRVGRRFKYRQPPKAANGQRDLTSDFSR